jgi:hypothetical protein
MVVRVQPKTQNSKGKKDSKKMKQIFIFKTSYIPNPIWLPLDGQMLIQLPSNGWMII